MLGNIETVRTLIESDRRLVNWTHGGGIEPITKAPLVYASQEGHVDIVELLISNGANVNHFDEDGISPLMFAAQKGHLGVVETLLAHGARVNHVDEQRRSALVYAIGKGEFTIADGWG